MVNHKLLVLLAVAFLPALAIDMRTLSLQGCISNNKDKPNAFSSTNADGVMEGQSEQITGSASHHCKKSEGEVTFGHINVAAARDSTAEFTAESIRISDGKLRVTETKECVVTVKDWPSSKKIIYHPFDTDDPGDSNVISIVGKKGDVKYDSKSLIDISCH